MTGIGYNKYVFFEILKETSAIAVIHLINMEKQKILVWYVIWLAFKIQHKYVAALMQIQYTKFIIVGKNKFKFK